MAQFFLDINNEQLQWGLIIASGVIVSALLVFIFQRQQGNSEKPSVSDQSTKHDPFDYGGTSEHRKAARRKGKNLEVELKDPTGTRQTEIGWIMDRSMGGLRLLSDSSWPAGMELHVRVKSKADFMPWVEVQVKHCEHTSNGWQLGCEFLHNPSWNLLLMFE